MGSKNCPETPRQKLIAMMYLVLTGLLALNVSKDILDAFILVDHSLTKTTANFSSKNDMTYIAFEKAYVKNKVKVAPWYEKADEVKTRSNELYDYIHDLKIKIVKYTDGKSSVFDGNVDDIEARDNADGPAVVMIGPTGEGEANDLRAAIEDYREYLISLVVNKKDDRVIKSIETNLETKDKIIEGATHTWQRNNFENLPLIAVITLMSKMQSDVRNAESDMISNLYSQIDEGAFKFNKLEATVIAKSDYVMTGGAYQAKVFLVACDTTMAPDIFVGKYDTSTCEMIGDYDSIPIIDNKGQYTADAKSIGVKKWGGVINYTAPDGSIKRYPFESEYEVAKSTLVVSPTKMNVFYIGVNNPVDISVAGVSAGKIRVSMSNGKIRKARRGGGYTVNVYKTGKKAVIRVTVDKKSMGKKKFRIMRVPPPIAKVAGKTGGKIKKNILLAQSGVKADLEGFVFDMKFKVTTFTVSATVGGFTYDEKSSGGRFSSKQKQMIKKCKRGTKIYIEDIKAVDPTGASYRLGTLNFKLN